MKKHGVIQLYGVCANWILSNSNTYQGTTLPALGDAQHVLECLGYTGRWWSAELLAAAGAPAVVGESLLQISLSLRRCGDHTSAREEWKLSKNLCLNSSLSKVVDAYLFSFSLGCLSS